MITLNRSTSTKRTASFKELRGTPFDPFGYLPSRRQERELIDWYRGVVEAALAASGPGNASAAVEIARAPERIRGYEGVKSAAVERVQAEVAELLAAIAQRAAA